MKKRGFQVDFAAHMAECEANYFRISKLMPDLAVRDHRIFGVRMPDGSSARVDIRVIERCRYTTTVSVVQEGLLDWVKAHEMTVRIYHDAEVTEVIACQKGRHFKARYEYPNKKMYHEDEKIQLNRFLGEWLTNCLSAGHSLEEIVLA